MMSFGEFNQNRFLSPTILAGSASAVGLVVEAETILFHPLSGNCSKGNPESLKKQTLTMAHAFAKVPSRYARLSNGKYKTMGDVIRGSTVPSGPSTR